MKSVNVKSVSKVIVTAFLLCAVLIFYGCDEFYNFISGEEPVEYRADA